MKSLTLSWVSEVSASKGDPLRSLLQWDAAALLGRYMELNYPADGYKRITEPVTFGNNALNRVLTGSTKTLSSYVLSAASLEATDS
jgi:hypothetical protein